MHDRRVLLILPLVALVVLAAMLGWRMGQPLTETQIINAFAARYLDEAPAGAAVSDCLATAGQGNVRLVVTCTHPGGRTFTYPAGPRGGLITSEQDPQT